MLSLSAALPRPAARFIITLGVVVGLVASSWQSPKSLAEGLPRPLQTDLTRQIVASGDDVNEDGSSYYSNSGTVWLGTGASPTASYTGLRFTSITIPQGATITSAKLQVYLPSSAWNQLSFTYAAENVGNSTAFSSSNRPSQRTLTAQTVSHSSNVEWPATTWYDLDEISSVVQPVISRADWSSGNALSIILKGTGGAYGRKYVTAYNGTPANAVRLVVTYSTGGATPTHTSVAPTATRTATQTSTPVGPTATATSSGGGSQLTRQIVASGDDVNEDGTDFYEDSDTVWLGTGASAAASYTGLRFINIAIPQGATITSAKLQVYLPSSSWNYLSFTCAAENAGNSAAFSSSNRPSQRALTTQTVTHASDVNWPANTWIDLDEISSVVQPVISRGDWTSGNALSIILKGIGGSYGRKFVTAYDGEPANAVRLLIAYSISPTTATSTSTASATATRTVTATASPSRTQTQLPSPSPTSTPTLVTPIVPPGEGGYPGPEGISAATPTSMPHRVYLTAIQNTRGRGGVHLGNRESDWNTPTDFLSRLRDGVNGSYPAVVVVLSAQVYTIHRSTTSPCGITHASVLHNQAFNYLTEAQRRGTRVVIRIYPSPGNFTDWSDPGATHSLRSDTVPAGGNYCNSNWAQFRAIDDIAKEMRAIFDINVANGWNPDLFFFVPANEPNKEWYADVWNENQNLSPNIDNSAAWQSMDAYFANVYNQAKVLNSNIKVLTPPMAQGLRAEERTDFQNSTCELTGMVVNGTPTASSGYQQMPLTQYSYNDGWSWNNYWINGLEFWQPLYCAGGGVSGHVFQAFPEGLRTTIGVSTKPAFITEADIISPCRDGQQTRPNLLNKDDAVTAAQESIWRFIQQANRSGQGADYVAVWILTNQYADPATTGVDCGGLIDGNQEIAWHEAYRDQPVNGSFEREWFGEWWLRPENLRP